MLEYSGKTAVAAAATVRRAAVAAGADLVARGCQCGWPASGPAQSALRPTRVRGFHATVDPVIDALWAGYDTAGGDGPRAVHQPVLAAPRESRLQRARSIAFASGSRPRASTVKVEEYPSGGPAWDHSAATLAIVRPARRTRSCCRARKIASRSASIRFRRQAAASSRRSSTSAAAIATRTSPARTSRARSCWVTPMSGSLWRRAVAGQGAIGVISTSLPAYLNADPPGAQADAARSVGHSSVDQRAVRRGAQGIRLQGVTARGRRRCGSGSPRAGAERRVRARHDHELVLRPVPCARSSRKFRALPRPAERIVLAAHIQEPGANDNASGVATLAELAVSMATAIRQKKIAAPERTLTFLFLNEISGSRRWLQDHPAEAKQVRYMFSLDMTGEDVDEDRRQFPDRALSRSGRGVGAAVGSAQRVGQGQRARGFAQGRSDQRRALGRRPAGGPRRASGW